MDFDIEAEITLPIEDWHNELLHSDKIVMHNSFMFIVTLYLYLAVYPCR